LLCAVALLAQDPVAEAFKADVRAARDAAAKGKTSDLRAARAHLDAAEARIDEIADARQRAQARLVVAVRRADLFFRAPEPNLVKAGELVRAAREAARRDGIWEGSYQETGLVLLWQSMPAVEFFALVEAAQDDLALLAGKKAVSADNEIPLRLMRADLHLAQGREREAVAEWCAVSEALRGPAAGLGDAWADKCHSALVWHLLERREYARAEVYVPFLRDAERRAYYDAVLHNQRGDFRATVTLLAGTRDPRALLLLGDAQEQLGAFDDAIATYDRVTRDAGADAELRAAAHNGLGDVYRRRDPPGDRERAGACYAQSLQLLTASTSRKVDSELAENYRDLGLLDELRGDRAAAYRRFVQALEQLERARAGIPLDPFGASFLEPRFPGVDVVLLGAVDGVLRTWQAGGAGPLDVLVAIDRVKARSLLDRVASPRALEESPEVLAAVRALALARDPQTQQRARLDLERARNAVGERTALVRPRPLDAAALRAELAAVPDAVVLAYWLGEASCYVVVARKNMVAVHELGTSARARQLLRGAVLAVDNVSYGDDPWSALAAAAEFFVPASIAPQVRGAGVVVFAPDDQLARLPFEALRIDGTPLGLGYDVERAPSLAVRALLRARPPAAGGTVVLDSVPLADEQRAAFGLDELRFSAREGDLVAGAWVRAERLQGEQATLTALQDAVRHTCRLLHISAHAVAHGAVPGASLLFLADGSVPLSAMAELPLLGATVVLSACSSAKGQALGGEGDAGLLWGPLGAGARTVIASLWAVNQQATCDLMGQMHYALARGASAAGALRAARRALAAAPNYAHPHYWAGFAAYGAAVDGSAPGRLATSRALSLFASVAAGALVLTFLVRRPQKRA
jgi:CHAT domain-containing protein